MGIVLGILLKFKSEGVIFKVKFDVLVFKFGGFFLNNMQQMMNRVKLY